MFSEDAEAVYRHFADPFAVFVGIGKEVYGPGLLVTHSAKEYQEAGITSDLLWEKLPLIHTFTAVLPNENFDPDDPWSSGPMFSEIDTTVPDIIEQRFMELQDLEGIPEEQRKTTDVFPSLNPESEPGETISEAASDAVRIPQNAISPAS